MKRKEEFFTKKYKPEQHSNVTNVAVFLKME